MNHTYCRCESCKKKREWERIKHKMWLARLTPTERAEYNKIQAELTFALYRNVALIRAFSEYARNERTD